MFNITKYILITLAWLMLLTFVVGFTLPDTWLGDSLASLLFYQVLAAALLSGLLYLFQQDLEFYLMLLLVAIGLLRIIYAYQLGPSAPLPPSRQTNLQTVSFAALNVANKRQSIEPMIDYFKQHGASIATVFNLPPGGAKPLLNSGFFTAVLPGDIEGSSFNLLGLSRIEDPQWDVYALGEEKVPMLKTTLFLGARQLTLFFVHFVRASSERLFLERNLELAQVIAMVNATAGEKVVVGDFNISPYSTFYSQFIEQTGLRPLRGIQWFSHTALSKWLGIGLPLSHVFLSSQLSLVNVSIGPRIDSGYLPLSGRVVIAEPST